MSWLIYIGAPASAIAIARGVWWAARRVSRRAAPDLDDISRLRVLDWLRGLAVFILRRRARRLWVLHHVVGRYCRRLGDSHRHLTIPGRGVKLPTDRCFIPLELRAGDITDVSQILHGRGAVAVLGDPGSGKSALLSQLVRQLCRECLENRRRSRLPVYVPLFDITPQILSASPNLSPSAAFDVLEQWFVDSTLVPMERYDAGDLLRILATSRNNGIVVLLDGLDELNASEIPRVETFFCKLVEFLRASDGDNLALLTSRRQALEFAPRLMSGALRELTTVELQPFSPAAIYAFLVHWPYTGLDGTTEAQRIFRQLRLSPTLLDACSNPLFLALYVRRDLRLRETGDDLDTAAPETRADFFADVTDYLLALRRSQREKTKQPVFAFRQSLHKYFVAVAADHIQGGETFNRIASDLMVRHAARLVREGSTAEAAVLELAKDTGVVNQNEDGTWSFIHRSFLDYFLGCTIATTQRKRQIDVLIASLHHNPLRYVEGFFFACGLMASRGWPTLPDILERVGSSAVVGYLYPRACLEAQAYDNPSFTKTIRIFCGRWRRDRSAEHLLRDLIAVLIDYEKSCRDLGRSAEVTFEGQLWPSLQGSGYSILQLVQLDLEIAMRVAGETDVLDVLEGSGVDDAIVALYEPSVIASLNVSELQVRPRLSAVVAEAALRSTLVANRLARREPNMFSRVDSGEPWCDAWPIECTKFAAVLALALPHVRSAGATERANFPHLTLLTFGRPYSRVVSELATQRWRALVALSVAALGAIVAMGLAGIHPAAIAMSAIAAAVGTGLVVRWLAISGRVSLASARALNLAHTKRDAVAAPARTVRFVAGTRHSLRKRSLRRPVTSDGTTFAVYGRWMSLLWRRFSPELGDDRLSLRACADIREQLGTSEIRRLLRSSS